jgi:hypothetical protein
MMALAFAGSTGAKSAETPILRWYRGNMHTHTQFNAASGASDTPNFVAQWFKSHDYQFVVITDHENLTDVGPLNSAHGKVGEFLVIQGQEITQEIADPGHPFGLRHAHVNGINTQHLIMPIAPPSPPSAVQKTAPVKQASTLPSYEAYGARVTMAHAYERNLAEIEKAGGLAQVNHPNLAWSASLEDLLPLKSPYLMEIWNAFAASNNLGGTDDDGHVSPSTEGLWDGLLSAGKVVWGTAGDDSHDYRQFDDAYAPSPGKGWVVVHASELSTQAIVAALAHGDFYASTGVRLADYHGSRSEISIQIAPPTDGDLIFTRYATTFIGKGGRVLTTVAGLSPRYKIQGDEGYVRASIIDSDGRRGWTQPVLLDPIYGALAAPTSRP